MKIQRQLYNCEYSQSPPVILQKQNNISSFVDLSLLFLSSLWSNASFWNKSAENNNSVPAEGADVVIPSGNTDCIISLIFSCYYKIRLLVDQQVSGWCWTPVRLPSTS